MNPVMKQQLYETRNMCLSTFLIKKRQNSCDICKQETIFKFIVRLLDNKYMMGNASTYLISHWLRQLMLLLRWQSCHKVAGHKIHIHG